MHQKVPSCPKDDLKGLERVLRVKVDILGRVDVLKAGGKRLTHLLMMELADIEKNVALASPAIAFPIIVFPVP